MIGRSAQDRRILAELPDGARAAVPATRVTLSAIFDVTQHRHPRMRGYEYTVTRLWAATERWNYESHSIEPDTITDATVRLACLADGWKHGTRAAEPATQDWYEGFEKGYAA